MSKPNDCFEKLLDHEDAKKIVQLYVKADHEIRFIGGCVRDCFLGRELKDVDMATTALPKETIALLQKNTIQTIPTGIEHGTITAILNNNPIEITTLRADVVTDGRHAQVSFTKDWKTDAERRDFTINALSLDSEGELHDYFNGVNDLENKRLRFIGDAAKRIQEDYLRILRYFRFASQLNWVLADEEELQICRQFADKLKNLSRERIQAELFKLILGDACIPTAEQMEKYGIWQALLDTPVNMSALKNIVDLENKHVEPDALRRLIAFIGIDNSEAFEKIAALSNKEKKRIEIIRKLPADQNGSLTKMLYEFGAERVLDYYYLQNNDSLFDTIKTWAKPVFPVKGSDIMALTKTEGPFVGVILKQIEDYWIAQNFKPSKEELMQKAQAMIAQN